ncbi:MAG TPA: IclR family transcriptional regulator [Candidatus Dormibacteraeota bacterium]|nr:IclR family transcriptional regulator [Candidatus Dormibacteraeota bacterium]
MQAVQRVADILLAFSGQEEPIGVSELGRRVGLPKSVTYRIAEALTRSGLLAREEANRRYRLGARAIELGILAAGRQDLRTLARPFLHELGQATGETAILSLRVGWQRIYVDQVESPQEVRKAIEIGKRCPLYAGASGRAILSAFDDEELDRYLREVQREQLTPRTLVDEVALRQAVEEGRRQGCCVSFGERDRWTASVATPLRGLGGHVIGALSVGGPVFRFTDEAVLRFVPLVRSAGIQLSRLLAGTANLPAPAELEGVR